MANSASGGFAFIGDVGHQLGEPIQGIKCFGCLSIL